MMEQEESVEDVPLPTLTYHDVYHSSDDDITTTDDDVMGTYIDELPPDQVSKPLMHPRQRPTVRVKSKRISSKRWQRFLWPLVYLFIFLASLAAFVCLIIYVVNVYTDKLLSGGVHDSALQRTELNVTFMGCSDMNVEDVWVVGLPKLLTESAMRLLDVNQDGVQDVIMGYATGVDKLRSSRLVCDIYFNGSYPCGGGIMALDGKTGRTLWMHWAEHEIFSLNCGADLDQDGIYDCIGGGRAGTFQAASGRSGRLLWRYNGTGHNIIMNAYTGQFIGDIDNDGVQDILNIHGGDPLGEPGSNTRLGGKLMLLSGRTGEVLQVEDVPDGRESYYSPVLYRRKDGTRYILYGTGGETHPGSLWIITMHDLLKGDINQSKPLYTDRYKGIMTPPVLVDISGDGTEDIIFATFNSTVMAIDGETFKPLWKFSHPNAETYATPAPGYYNDDAIPDFLIRLQIGPGFPIYFYSVTTILDGATGRPLLDPYLRDSVGAQTSPLTMSMQGLGQDIFLYWISDCEGMEGMGDKFEFLKGTNVHEQSRADFCRLRFKTSGYSKMLAISQSLGSPGKDIYNSEERYHVERNSWVNASYLAEEFLRAHPAHRLAYRKWQEWIAENQQTWRQRDREKEERRGRVESEMAERTGLESKVNVDDSYRGRMYGDDDLVSTDRGQWLPNEDDRNLQENEYQTEPTDEREEMLQERIKSIVKDILDSSEEGDWDSSYGMKERLNLDRPVPSQRYDEKEGQERRPYNVAQKMGLTSYHGRTRKGERRPDLGRGRSSDGRKSYPYGDVRLPPRKLMSPGDSLGKPPDLDVKYMMGDGTSKRAFDMVGELPQTERTADRESVSGADGETNLHDLYLQSFGRRKSLRKRRHVGPHDEGGLQRLISTGTLAPPLMEQSDPDYGRSMDVLFATYWFYPAKTKILLEEDTKCIENMMNQEVQRLDPKSEYYGMDHDGYEHEVTERCLEKSGHIPEQGTYESQSTYNPYDVHMGQMTVYRLRVKCECEGSTHTASPSPHTPDKARCASFLPFHSQQWPAYMGARADSHWTRRTQNGEDHQTADSSKPR